MARKRTRAEIEATARRTAELLAEDVPADPADDAELDALDALASLGGDSAVRFVVKCIKPYDRAGQILSNLAREEIRDLPERLTDQFGPGKYEVFAKDAGGRYLPGRHAVIEISPAARRSDGTSAAVQPAGPAVVGAPASSSSHADLVRELEARNERARIESREDRKWLVETLVGALPALVTLVQGRTPPSLADQINALGGIKALAGDGRGDGVQTLLEGVRLARELEGGAPESWQGIVGEGLKTVQALITRQPALGPARRPIALPAPAGSPEQQQQPAGQVVEQPAARAAAPADAGAPELTGQWAIAGPILHKLAGELVEYANTGADADLVANALLAKVPPAWLRQVNPDELLELLRRPDWWQWSVQFHPALSGRHQYIEGVRQAFVRMLEQPAEQAAASAGDQK